MTGIVELAEEMRYERRFYKKEIQDTWKSFLDAVGLIHELRERYNWTSPLSVKASHREHVFISNYLGIPASEKVDEDIAGNKHISGRAPQIKWKTPEFFKMGCEFAEASYDFRKDLGGRKILCLWCMIPTDSEQKKSIEQLINETFPVDAPEST